MGRSELLLKLDQKPLGVSCAVTHFLDCVFVTRKLRLPASQIASKRQPRAVEQVPPLVRGQLFSKRRPLAPSYGIRVFEQPRGLALPNLGQQDIALDGSRFLSRAFLSLSDKQLLVPPI